MRGRSAAAPFSLDVTTPGQAADFDVTFYRELGTCVWVQNPVTGVCGPLIGEPTEPGCRYDGVPPIYGRVLAGEEGRLPNFGTPVAYAIVTMAAGVPGTAFRFAVG